MSNAPSYLKTTAPKTYMNLGSISLLGYKKLF